MGKLISLSEYREQKKTRLKGEIAVADEYNKLTFKTNGIVPGGGDKTERQKIIEKFIKHSESLDW